ncbi:hypothetical protein K438DRAFT_1786232 [Mycena galopus ATCC 62051]|nr:hypothetical protein K438DRAFT_1786232 [Mycena galopus ATCC 62051]
MGMGIGRERWKRGKKDKATATARKPSKKSDGSERSSPILKLARQHAKERTCGEKDEVRVRDADLDMDVDRDHGANQKFSIRASGILSSKSASWGAAARPQGGEFLKIDAQRSCRIDVREPESLAPESEPLH